MAVGDLFANNFGIGDVVYGLSQSRAPYIASLPKALSDYCREYGAFLICDEFNNRSFLGVSKDFGTPQVGSGDQPTFTNPASMNDIRYNLDFYEHGRGLAVLGVEQKAAAKAFYDSLADNRRSPEKALAEPATKRQTNNDTVSTFMIRRACKFGLEHMIMVRHQTVHFALDVPFNAGTMMDMTNVVAKSKMSGGNVANVNDQAAQVPITFSELRCCYRNRATWMPTGRLKFYLNLQEVDAPWVQNAALWQQYDTARAIKAYKKKHPVLAKLGFGP
jgi:hypothetical protein